MSLLTGKNYIVIPKAITVERLALTAVNGMLVYDTTLNAFYKYENGAWSSFGGGSTYQRIVVSSNQTAENDKDYTLVASATFTDPTPAEGKGYSVLIRNGTATIGAVGYSTVGTLVWRLFHSGSWATYVLTNQAQLDAKLDIVYKRSLLTFTGTTNERALDIIPLDVNSFDYLYRFFVWSRVDVSTATVRIRIGTTAAPIDGAVGANSIGQQTLLGSFALTNNNRSPFVRNINIVGGASGSAVSMVAAVLSDELQIATSTSIAIDTTTQLYMYISVGLSVGTRVFTSDSAVVTKIKLT